MAAICGEAAIGAVAWPFAAGAQHTSPLRRDEVPQQKQRKGFLTASRGDLRAITRIRKKETIMRQRFFGSVISCRHCRGRGQRRHFGAHHTDAGSGSNSFEFVATAPALKTPWGEPDLQGIWTDETDTPLQRPAKYSNQEFFTEAQREEMDKERSALLARDSRAERGTERDVEWRLQFGVLVSKAHRCAHLEDCRSSQWPASVADARGSEGGRRRSGILPRAVAIDRDLQEQVGRLQRREIRSDALAATRGASSSLQHPAHQSR